MAPGRGSLRLSLAARSGPGRAAGGTAAAAAGIEGNSELDPSRAMDHSDSRLRYGGRGRAEMTILRPPAAAAPARRPWSQSCPAITVLPLTVDCASDSDAPLNTESGPQGGRAVAPSLRLTSSVYFQSQKSNAICLRLADEKARLSGNLLSTSSTRPARSSGQDSRSHETNTNGVFSCSLVFVTVETDQRTHRFVN